MMLVFFVGMGASARPGATIGVNGLCGNLGIAAAALLTGLLVQWAGWRAAFAVPGLLCLLLAASQAQGWWLYACLLGVMALVVGAIPFTDAVIVRHVDDRCRSRVAGLRLAVSLGVSASAVWALGPLVKASSFSHLYLGMAGVALCTALALTALPQEPAPARPG